MHGCLFVGKVSMNCETEITDRGGPTDIYIYIYTLTFQEVKI